MISFCWLKVWNIVRTTNMWWSLLQGIFPTPGLNPGLPYCRRILDQLSHRRSPQRVTEIKRRQTLLEKWHRWTCLTQGCYKPSVCKHSLQSTIKWRAMKRGLPAYMCVFSHSAVSHSAAPWTVAHQAPLSMGILQARILGLPYPAPGHLPSPEIKPRSPILQVDSLPPEPPGKPEKTGVGSLSLFQGIFLTTESNQCLLLCR